MSSILHTVWHFIHRWRLLTAETLFGYVALGTIGSWPPCSSSLAAKIAVTLAAILALEEP